MDLLHRTPRGLTLSEAGRRYRGAVEVAFAGLAQATADLRGPDLSRPLTISLTSEFGLRWLMPRFHRFRALHPDIDTAILSTYHVVDLQAGEADVALRYGAGRWPGVEAEPILHFNVSPVCAPAVRQVMGDRPLAEALTGLTFIREHHDNYDDWDLWLAAAGLDGFTPSRELRFVDYSMAMAAAVNGHGVALGYSDYIDREIAAELLVYPFDLRVPTGKGYYLVYRKERLADPRVEAFRDWVMAEVAAAGAAAEQGVSAPSTT